VIRPLAGAVLILAVGVSPLWAKRARTQPGLEPGAYTVKILAPTLSPAMSADEQVFRICYSAADAAAHANPIMPAAERAACKHDTFIPAIGDDLVYDDSCADGSHRLRITRINEASWQGTYRLVGKGKPPLMLEPTVQLRREGTCP
jgi:hypothetical protein